MIQTSVSNGRGGTETIDHHDPRYWEGPYRYVPYPKMLFKATAGDGYTNTERCVVQNEREHQQLGSDWAESPDDARAIADRRDADMAKAAAERNAADQKLSRPAQAEALKIDRATDEMLGDITVGKRK